MNLLSPDELDNLRRLKDRLRELALESFPRGQRADPEEWEVFALLAESVERLAKIDARHTRYAWTTRGTVVETDAKMRRQLGEGRGHRFVCGTEPH